MVVSKLAASEFDFDPFSGVPRRYVIAGLPRSGSNLLCHLLANTGLMGYPTEYLHPESLMVPMAQRFSDEGAGAVTYDSYVAELLKRRSSPNGVFGLKTFYWQATPYVDQGRFKALFEGAEYAYLTRQDRRGQIVSMAIASQTQQWTSYDERQAEAAYDEELILRAGGFLAQEARSWEQFFAARGIEPLRITYEGLLADPDVICRSVCSLVDVVPQEPFRIERAETKKQRNAVNEEWLRKAESILAAYD